VYYGQTGSLFWVQVLVPRVTVHSSLSYIRGSGLSQTISSTVHSAYGAAGIDVLLRRNLVFSTNYFLASQSLINTSSFDGKLRQSTVAAQIQYFYAPRNRRR
jgi:hypothetical protein